MDATVPIPSSADVRRLLGALTLPRLRELAVVTGVPFGTLYKIASGETTNPGIETTRRFYAVAHAWSAEIARSVAAEQEPARDAA